MVPVILGMHKSGTTLISQILHHSGINMVDESPVSKTYDQGFQYERKTCRDLNESILDCAGADSLAILPPSELRMSERQRRSMREIVSKCRADHGEQWGFKDPRTCLTYPLWREELGPHRLIVVHRPVEELWLRYRHNRLYRRPSDPVRAWKVMDRWHEANARVVDYLSETDQEFLVVDYRRLMTGGDELARLEAFVGRTLNDQRRPDLYRNHVARPLPLIALYKKLVGVGADRSISEVERELRGLSTLDPGGRRSGRHHNRSLQQLDLS